MSAGDAATAGSLELKSPFRLDSGERLPAVTVAYRTWGRLDGDAFFYLRARGLGARAARALLTWAFASELVSRVKTPAVRTTLERWLLDWLPRGEEARS